MASSADIERAAQVLREGGLIAFPTETVYGLGANADDVAAVERVFAVKGRPATHPLIVHVADREALCAWAAEVPTLAQQLATHFWPGPLTLVLRRSARVPPAVTGGLETVAIRVPEHPTALALLRAFDGAIAAPSANRFGAVSPTTAQHVRDDLGDEVDFLLDGGACSVGVESTIVDATGTLPVVLRPGGITHEAIEAALGVAPAQPADERVRAPGMHAAHYAPRAKVLLVAASELADQARRHAASGRRVGVLGPAGAVVEGEGVVALPLPSTLDAYARELYALLREGDERGCDIIVASLPSEEGIGVAIADRLRRAANG
jgi:L-threonylcarbamoyladenylate synthase